MPTQQEISLNPTSAKGNILTSNGSSRIAVSVGTNGQVLTSVSSAAAGLEYRTYASGTAAMVLISSSTVTTSGVTQIILSNIDTARTYASYRMIFQYGSTAGIKAHIHVNSVSSGYFSGGIYNDGSASIVSSETTSYIVANRNVTSSNANVFNVYVLDLFPQAKFSSSNYLNCIFRSIGWSGALSTSGLAESGFGMAYNSQAGNTDAALSTIEIKASTSSWTVGTRVFLYGFVS